MFYVCSIVVIFCLQLWKGKEAKKTKRLTLNDIKKKLIDSLFINDTIECDESTIKVQEVEDPEKAAELIRECESIIRKKKKSIIRIAYHQGMVFKKFKDKEKFKSLVEKLGIHKTTLTLKINLSEIH